MGFNKKYLPSLEELKKRLERNPGSLQYYLKADALIGPSESIDYLKELAAKEKKQQSKS